MQGSKFKTRIESFTARYKINRLTGCWEWIGGIIGAKNPKGGYAKMVIDKKIIGAHRFAYSHYKGSVPDGCEIDHLCRNRKCVNPEHLEAVTHQENVKRGMAGKHGNYRKIGSHCPKGHPYEGENIYIYRGEHFCRMCRSIYGKIHHARAKAKKAISTT